ncbi:sigma-70 family RNA polymerase sigma factor [Streptomyces sp. HNM0575]|uniref:RNA polymerase sigma factor n=1 Tax=Streptomyces sp. HNM0575 TaxID=2716338 RepID=UPI00145E0F5B|nr:sigma-70 family RNA polymerase sigma factor [Streptomyces sp. HNM0575]NLU73324.1 sigma-70 family RNA polymerase sigma factor [Streptomyces sp. HNM0575]
MPEKRERSSNSGVCLTEAADRSDAPAVLDELLRRHRSAVFSYALACCRDTGAAEALTTEAFTRTVRTARSGESPVSAWRPHLLISVRRTAAEWAATEHRDGLSPDFLQWYDHAIGGLERENGQDPMTRLEEGRVVFRAFRSLPERWQTVLWHTAVEAESEGRVGRLLGVAAGSVGALAARAREGLRESYLAAHYENDGCEAGDCRRYGALVAAAVRGAGRRGNDDLDRHLGECDGCRGALAELADLDERLSTVLPAGVLLWGGSAYVATRLAEATTTGGDETGETVSHAKNVARWWGRSMRLSIPAAALAGSLVAVAGIAVYLIPLISPSDDEASGSQPLQVVSRPPETVIKDGPTVTSTPTPAPSGERPAHGSPELPKSGGGLTALHLRSDRTLGAAQSRSGTVTLAKTTGNHDGKPHNPVTFVRSGITGEYDGGGTRFDLFVDARTTIGNGQQLRVSYDLTGDGSWDRVETYRYFESDDAPGYEHYTHSRDLGAGTKGALGDMEDGTVKVEVWDAIGAGGSTVGTGDTSVVRIPFG